MSSLPHHEATPAKTPADWVRLLDAQLNPRFARRIQVTYGRARTTPIHVKWPPGRAEVRMHQMFAHAPEEVVQAVGQWLQSGRRARRACALLDEWIHRALGELPPVKPRRVTLEPIGKSHDLSALSEGLFEDEFAHEFGTGSEGAELRPGVTFGRRSKSRSRHTLQLGSYSPEKNVVRIHPVLDQEAVPDWFVRFVLFHEILHAVLEGPRAREGGKRAPRVMHGPAFRNRERGYFRYEEAVAWEREWIARLIRSARSGVALKDGRVGARTGEARRVERGDEGEARGGWVQRVLFGGKG